MSFLTRQSARQSLSIAAVAAAFVLVSWFAREHRAVLVTLVEGGGVVGPLAFVLLTAAFVVFVIPLDLVLLIPLGTTLWGPVATALLSIAGWTLGASIAFLLARGFGKPLVARLVGDERLVDLQKRVPVGSGFWSVCFLRLLVPVDFLSYALGLFGAIPWGRYVAATALGVAPFGFYFAYAGALAPAYQALAVAVALAGAFIIFTRTRIG